MRSRTIREGSVGLLILMGLAVFVGLVVWLRGINLANRSYKFIVNFTNVAGMKTGAQVRYRGVSVGKITEVKARTNGVDATIEITPANLLIPRDVLIEANQVGLVGETSIDMTPLKPLPKEALSNNPLSRQCKSKLIICDQDRLSGQIGVSFDELLRSTIRIASVYSNPAFFDNVNTLTKNTSVAASGVAQLTGELSLLSRSFRREAGSFSTSAKSLTSTTNQTVSELGRAASRSLDQVGVTASRFGNTADQYSLTASQLNKLVSSTNELVVANRGTLVKTLNSVSQTSDQLREILRSLTPALAQVNSTVGNLNSAAGKLNSTAGEVKIKTLVQNLETLSANAAQASANLRDITTALNNPSNALVLQQTLDSARATFENAQKITSDLDELTGDPAFRNNLKQLVNGLGNLVSSTQQLQQQVQVAQTLEPVSAMIHTTVSSATPRLQDNQQSQPNVEQVAPSNPMDRHKESLLMPPAPKKPLPEANSQLAADAEPEKR